MVIDEFDIFCTSISPDEAETRLRVHADIVLTASVADQTLQAVAWRHSEVLDVLRRMNQLELSQRRPLHGTIAAFDVLLMPDALGALVPEGSDHEPSA